MEGSVAVRLDRDRPEQAALFGRIERIAGSLGCRLEPADGTPERVEVGPAPIALDPEAPQWRIEAALLGSLRPRHLVFLCVANSARSQMAHGIAAALAPDGVQVSSAGSEPTSVRPQAIAALAEIGLDIAHHRSRGVEDVERTADAVVTLCAEEVCPVWLEDAWRLHWGLPDPAAVEGTDEERLQAFREVRDELRERLAVLFAARGSGS